VRFRNAILLSWRGRQLSAAMDVARAQGQLEAAASQAPARITYVVCTNPRSGSYLLCDGLASTKVAGRPREWFNPLADELRRARWGLGPSTPATDLDYLLFAKARSTTPNGVSGIKLHYSQFVTLCQNLVQIEGFEDLGEAELMAHAFPNLRYIFLTRRNKDRQAISYFLARETDEWVSPASGPDPAQGLGPEMQVEPEEIERLATMLSRSDAAWRSYFTASRISPLEIFYEDLVADYRGEIVRVLDWLGITDANSIEIPDPRLRQQSDARNEHILERYATYRKSQDSAARQTTASDSQDMKM